MSKLYGVLAYGCGCLAPMLVGLGLLIGGENRAGANYVACPDDNPNCYLAAPQCKNGTQAGTCAEPGGQCTQGSLPSTCSMNKLVTNCTCGGI